MSKKRHSQARWLYRPLMPKLYDKEEPKREKKNI